MSNKSAVPVVVVDTSTIFDDLRLRRLNWMQLLALCANGEIRLVLPHAVVRESVRHWNRQADQAAKDTLANFKKLKGLGLDVAEWPALGAVDAVEHEQYLKERLTKVGAELYDLPGSATIEDLLQRDLQERKPFAASGKGFRDTLNWMTILEVAAEPDVGQIYWVSKDSGDFSDGQGELHPDLVGDLNQPDQVIWVRAIGDLLKRPEFAPLVAGLAASPQELEEYLTSSLISAGTSAVPQTTDDFIRDALVDAAERLVGASVESPYSAYESSGIFDDFGLPSEVDDVTIEYVDANPESVSWTVYESFDDTTLLVEATMEASLSFEGFADKFDALHAEDFEVLDFDWNDHVSHVGFSHDAILKFQLRVEEGVGVDSVELEGAEPA